MFARIPDIVIVWAPLPGIKVKDKLFADLDAVWPAAKATVDDIVGSGNLLVLLGKGSPTTVSVGNSPSGDEILTVSVTISPATPASQFNEMAPRTSTEPSNRTVVGMLLAVQV